MGSGYMHSGMSMDSKFFKNAKRSDMGVNRSQILPQIFENEYPNIA